MLDPAASVPAAVEPTTVEPSVVATVPAVKAPAAPFTHTKAWPSYGCAGNCTFNEVDATVEIRIPCVFASTGDSVPVVCDVREGLAPPRICAVGTKMEVPPRPPMATCTTSFPVNERDPRPV